METHKKELEKDLKENVKKKLLQLGFAEAIKFWKNLC